MHDDNIVIVQCCFIHQRKAITAHDFTRTCRNSSASSGLRTYKNIGIHLEHFKRDTSLGKGVLHARIWRGKRVKMSKSTTCTYQFNALDFLGARISSCSFSSCRRRSGCFGNSLLLLFLLFLLLFLRWSRRRSWFGSCWRGRA